MLVLLQTAKLVLPDITFPTQTLVLLKVLLIVLLIPLILTLALPVLPATSFQATPVFSNQFPIAQHMSLALQTAKLALLDITFQTRTLVLLKVSPTVPLIPPILTPVSHAAQVSI